MIHVMVFEHYLESIVQFRLIYKLPVACMNTIYISICLFMLCVSDHIGLGDVILSRGTKEIPFTFVLPPDCPGSFDGDAKCNLRYFVRAVLHLKLKKDHIATVNFRVNSILNLNQFPKSLVRVYLYTFSSHLIHFVLFVCIVSVYRPSSTLCESI